MGDFKSKILSCQAPGVSMIYRMLGTVKKTKLSEEAYKILRKAILSRRYLPGTRLLVRELAESLGLSPTPIKEALAALEKEGLIRAIPHKGYQVPLLNLEDVREIYELREVLEGLAARLATLKGDPRLGTLLAKILEEQEQAVQQQDLEAYGDLDLAFHRTLWEASSNQRLQQVAENLDGQIRLLISTSAAVPGRLPKSLAEHRFILEKIQKGDAQGAEVAMREHVLKAWRALEYFWEND